MIDDRCIFNSPHTPYSCSSQSVNLLQSGRLALRGSSCCRSRNTRCCSREAIALHTSFATCDLQAYKQVCLNFKNLKTTSFRVLMFGLPLAFAFAFPLRFGLHSRSRFSTCKTTRPVPESYDATGACTASSIAGCASMLPLTLWMSRLTNMCIPLDCVRS